MRNICLQASIVYGPLHSRRLGESLGINLSPVTFKLCDLNCVYCQYGFSKMRHFNHIPEKYFPKKLLIFKEIENALVQYPFSGKKIDCITFAGNGEPTLHPDFSEIAERTYALRNKLLPQAKLAILSNATMVSDPAIQKILQYFDKKIMKLDAGNHNMFRLLNHPHYKINFSQIIESLSTIKSVIIQTLFVQGSINNSTDEHVDLIIKRYKKIKPESIQIYSIDRTPADKGILQVPIERLNEIRERITKVLDIPVDVF